MSESMPVAAGMDSMEETTDAEPFAIPQGGRDVSSDTYMRETTIAASDTPDLFDWDQDEGGNSGMGAMDYSMDYDIGTKSPPISVAGSGEAAKGTPATASGQGGGPSNMNPSPYGSGDNGT